MSNTSTTSGYFTSADHLSEEGLTKPSEEFMRDVQQLFNIIKSTNEDEHMLLT